MGAFYIFLNAFSAFFLVFSLVSLVLFKRWGKHEFARIEKKRKELEDILNSADQMIDEMNRFSDYVITNLEEKSCTVEEMVTSLEEKIKRNKEYIDNVKIHEKTKKEAKPETAKTIIPFQNRFSSTVNDKVFTESKPNFYESENLKPKISSSKSIQILQLAEKGLDETEIAKKLNVGRGEIQLVLGMSKGVKEA
ncbi:MAG: DUF6115 domain-containing protein [Deltaproteobacteria bacterium]